MPPVGFISDPSKVLAIMVMIGMILGPWIMHERTLSRMEYKMDFIESRIENLSTQATENKAILAERKKAFEEIMAELKTEIARQKEPGVLQPQLLELPFKLPEGKHYQ